MGREITIDDKFVSNLRKGDMKSFHQLYEHFAPSMKLICKRYVKNDADADDVFHEGFLKVYKNIGSLKKSSSLVGWMKRIFINAALDHYKKSKGEMTENIDEVNEQRIDNQDSIGQDDLDFNGKARGNELQLIRRVDFTQEEMLETLKQIPEHFRVVFQLFVIDEYKHQEIADLLSINVKTSKTRLLRARILLKEELFKLANQKIRDGRSG